MQSAQPKVSIGLAVFNGEKYLRQAIESILAQTFSDFEIIISDNASTDGTADICQEYVALDSRIRYHRNATNIGGARNESLTFQLSKGQYFRNAAHDDILAPHLIEKCVEVLDRDPSIALCYSTIVKIDEQGQQIGVIEQDIATSNRPFDRFCDLASMNHGCEATYGLMRSSILQKTDLQLNYSDSDRTWLCEIGLYGKFYRIPEPLFYQRFHAEMSTEVYPDLIDRMAWFNPSDQEKINHDLEMAWVQLRHYFRIISRAPLTMSERAYCYWHTLNLMRSIGFLTFGKNLKDVRHLNLSDPGKVAGVTLLLGISLMFAIADRVQSLRPAFKKPISRPQA
jgi:glycosyltransferase involved in cell wall biosynthesis